MAIRLDLNNEIFQAGLFSLEKREQTDVLKTLKKMRQMTWEQVYADSGLKWGKIHSVSGANERILYSLRVSQRHRAVAYRDQDWMVLLSLHPNYDSAYE